MIAQVRKGTGSCAKRRCSNCLLPSPLLLRPRKQTGSFLSFSSLRSKQILARNDVVASSLRGQGREKTVYRYSVVILGPFSPYSAKSTSPQRLFAQATQERKLWGEKAGAKEDSKTYFLSYNSISPRTSCHPQRKRPAPKDEPLFRAMKSQRQFAVPVRGTSRDQTSAWRTADACGPSSDRTSCAPPYGRRE